MPLCAVRTQKLCQEQSGQTIWNLRGDYFSLLLSGRTKQKLKFPPTELNVCSKNFFTVELMDSIFTVGLRCFSLVLSEVSAFHIPHAEHSAHLDAVPCPWTRPNSGRSFPHVYKNSCRRRKHFSFRRKWTLDEFENFNAQGNIWNVWEQKTPWQMAVLNDLSHIWLEGEEK